MPFIPREESLKRLDKPLKTNSRLLVAVQERGYQRSSLNEAEQIY